MKSWCRRDGDGWLLHLHVQPGAKKSGVAGLHGDALKVRIAAPPAAGRANAERVGEEAEQLGVPKAALELVRGATSRQKTVRLRAGDPSGLVDDLP